MFLHFHLQLMLKINGTSKTDVAIMVWICIREILGSDLGMAPFVLNEVLCSFTHFAGECRS
jgi:hypothetical protein